MRIAAAFVLIAPALATVEVRDAGEMGLGVFATRNVKRNEYVCWTSAACAISPLLHRVRENAYALPDHEFIRDAPTTMVPSSTATLIPKPSAAASARAWRTRQQLEAQVRQRRPDLPAARHGERK